MATLIHGFRLNRLKMENGWKPLYEYNKQKIGGEPFVYASNRSGDKDFLYNRIISDGTNEGFIQLTILYLLHDKFCLYWHSLYKLIEIIISIKDLASLPFDDKTLLELSKYIDIQIVKDSNFIYINICTFNKWIGLQKIPFVFRAEYPHEPKIINDKIQLIKKYDCEIIF